MERICQDVVNLLRTFNITQTYVDKYDAWLGILNAAAFVIRSTTNMLKAYSLVQLLFIHDIILPIKHKVGWELLRKKNQMQINKDNIRKNIKQVDHDYKVGDKFMLNNNTS